MSRLTNASGISTEHNSDGGDVFSSYSMGMEYNIMSSPLLYDLTITSTSGTKSTENTYLYGDIQPGAPVKVGDTDYKYDASGNPVSMRGGDSDRTLKYDAEKRLRVIEDTQNGTMSLYTYNHTGERSLKRYGAFNTAYLNGAYAGSGLDGLTRYSAYVSPYYVEHGTGTNASNATKHYYIGTERLVSKLVTEKGGKEDVKDEDTYYYFTDHLGSTTHITDKGSKVVQYAAYTPYGTLFREYKSVMPYKFNGKELDQETGYYYYGARYYDPTTALWLGVDPLQMKYPGVSPYVYCNGNPVKYVDPDGRDAEVIFDEEINTVTIKANLIFYGEKVSEEVVQAYKDNIMSTWGRIEQYDSDDKSYSVVWDLDFRIMGKDEQPDYRVGVNNYIEVKDIKGSKVSYTNSGKWRCNGRNGKTLLEDNPAAHEFGHIIGAWDKYKNVDGVSKPVSEDWIGNIMATGTGTVSNKNMERILGFTTPPCKDEGPKECRIVNINANFREPK